mmetsp:Transcript_33611/g.71678  ORF Transcript_33611/g.71678 Transcript_33611/m.71678 type:complete len:341 (+) Transcript_33611:241-1263(+)
MSPSWQESHSQVGFYLRVLLWLGKQFGVDLRRHERRAGKGASHEEDPDGAPTEPGLQWPNGEEADRGSDGPTPVDEPGDSPEGLVIPTDRGVGCKISSDSGGDDVVGTSDEDSHDAQHDEKCDGIELLRLLGEDAEEDEECRHERPDDRRATSPKEIRNVSHNDSAGHHPHGVQRRDEVSGDGIEMLPQEVRQPEEEHVVRQLEKPEREGVLRYHGNPESGRVGDGGRAFVDSGPAILSVLRLEFFHANPHLRGDDPDVGGVGHEVEGEEAPDNVRDSGDEEGPGVVEAGAEDEGRADSGSDVAAVLVAGPKAEDEATVFDRLLVAVPVTHDSSSDWSSR